MTLESRPFHRPALAARLRLCSLAAALCVALVAPVSADELQDANQFLRQGQHVQALDKVNQYLASRPRDAQGRFLKGLILTEQNKMAEAIDIFTKLTQDYPELPEPYNNLAVLYAAQGQYERARQALEMSIRTHPSYATAYENLGDVYTKLASQAYDKALQLDSSNSTAKTKLSLVRDLIGGGTSRPAPVAAKPAAKPPAPAPAPAPRTEVARAEAPKAAAPAPAETRPAVPAASEAQRPAAAPAPAPAADAAAKSAPKPAPAVDPGSEEVIKAVQSWAQAWGAKDVKGYLGHYARDFKTPKGEPRAEWEKDRAARITAPKEIDVGIASPKVSRTSDTAATVTFRQAYRSDRLNVSSTKTLVMVKMNGRWLIQQERVGG